MTSAEARFVKFAREHRRCTLEEGAAETNHAYGSMVVALRELRETPDKGVSFLERTAAGNDLGVAAWAALYLLPYREQQATSVLSRIATAGIPRLSFNAQMTLREWEAGRLKIE